MEWFVYNGGLICCGSTGRHPSRGYIQFDQFENLTGRKIDWTVRDKKYIITYRDKGHLKLRDKDFIIGIIYKHNNKEYLCEHIDKEGYALLTSVQNTLLEAISTKNTIGWEIINENSAISNSIE